MSIFKRLKQKTESEIAKKISFHALSIFALIIFTYWEFYFGRDFISILPLGLRISTPYSNQLAANIAVDVLYLSMATIGLIQIVLKYYRDACESLANRSSNKLQK